MPVSLRHHRESKLWALSAGDVSIWPMGPAGGSGGTWFNDVADHRLHIPTVSVLRVEGRHGDTLDSLSVTYQSAGLSAGPFKHGTSGGGQDYSNFVMGRGDRLIMVEGWIHVFSLNHELNGLRFTAQRPDGSLNVGVVGKAKGSGFTFQPVQPSEIVCFFGRQGLFVDAFGIFYRPLPS